MGTLDRWHEFLVTPRTLAFPHLELIGPDFTPPIVKGSGEVRMPSLNHFEFTLTGLPENVAYAFAQIVRQRRDPYDHLARFRLRGTDESGIRWLLGWTLAHFEPSDEAWTFEGRVDGLWPDDENAVVNPKSCTELVFVVPVSHPVAHSMLRFMLAGHGGDSRRHTHVLEILGSTIEFQYDPIAGVLSITATHSSKLPPTYSENWLGEPLRILFGQLIFPRLVARNLGDGRTHVSIRRSPALIRSADWNALWQDKNHGRGKEAFWRHYADILTVIARGRSFEANKITQLYEEVIQAARGTLWVWAMTCASCIEALANMLEPPGRARSEADTAKVEALVKHINDWQGDDRLKRNAVNGVQRSLKTTTIDGLRQLVTTGAIEPIQLKTWEEIRNSVMHGSLMLPYVQAEKETNRLLALADLMRALTLEILRREPDSGDGASGAV